MTDEWMKFKRYPHIGIPLTKKKDENWLKEYVTNPKIIAIHKFTPFLHKTISQRKFRPVNNIIKNPSGKRQRSSSKKERPIYFSSHLDSIIYSYYSSLLTQFYEKYLEDKPFSTVAVAYRKIPVGNGNPGNKSNIEFALEAFKFIEDNKGRRLSIIVADITSFFNNLNHRLLHSQWKKVLGTTNLPDDHYAVYKNLINIKYVKETDLFNRFKHKLLVERHILNDTSKKALKQKHIKNMYNMRHENVVAYCSKNDFYREATDLIRVDKPNNSNIRKNFGKEEKKGIPQGTPISATLANIYMIDFDERIYREATTNSRNAYYQRYSDDLIIICDQKDEQYFYSLLEKEIVEKAKLSIQPQKTKRYRYELSENLVFKGGIDEDGIVNPNKQLMYLGFEYDGTKVLVKPAGFSKFYRKMKRSYYRGVYFAKKAYIPSNSLFETRLYKKFTHLGSKRRLKWLPDANSSTGFRRSTQYDWGNFLSYLNKANNAMQEINKDDSIKRQYRKVWNKFHEVKENAYKKIAKAITSDYTYIQ